MRDKVARVRRLLEEAMDKNPSPPTTENLALQAFTLYEFNSVKPYIAEQTPRARALREIMRIANWYGWANEVDRALDSAGAMTALSLSDDQIEALLARMNQMEDCVQNATDCPDGPPAR